MTDDMHGCPWIVSSYAIKSEDATEAIYTGNNVPYIGPTKVSSDCSAIPLDPYDVSWNENTVVHNKIVTMQSTGAVIEQTLPTYLMEGGKLCDGSNIMTSVVLTAVLSHSRCTFSTSGCDDAKVTVTPEPQPITVQATA
ncbi:StfH/YfcO family fimbrial adhesin [Escherichia coli]|nr:StfH/YfcO family fimbrial adhesin [Escherichia coli]